jgi:hypothetical protein
MSKYIALFIALALAPLLSAQNQAVTQEISTKRVKDSLKIPSGKTLTIENGASLVAESSATVSIAGLAPYDAYYITKTANATLINEFALSSLATGLLKVTNTTGDLSSVSLSADIATVISDETGTGVLVFGTSPSFTTQITVPKIVWTGSMQDLYGTGSPEGVVTADVGSIYRRTDGGTGTTLYVKQSGTGNTGWAAAAGGGGDVTGPASATDNAVARFDATTGKIIQNSNVTLADSGTAFVFSGAAGITASGTNQNVVLTPSGTGKTIINGDVGFSTTSPNIGAWSRAITLDSGSTSSIGFEFNNSADTDAAGVGGFAWMRSGWANNTLAQIYVSQAGATSGNRGAHMRFYTKPNGSAVAEVMRLTNTANLLIGLTTDGTGKIQLAAATTAAGGIAFGTDTNLYRSAADTLKTDDTIDAASIRIASSPPATATSTGTTGTIAWDSGFIYICTATNTWKRVAIATW